MRNRSFLFKLSVLAIGTARVLPGGFVSDAKAQELRQSLDQACAYINQIDDIEQLTRIAECINNPADSEYDWCTEVCSQTAIQRIVDLSAPAAGPPDVPQDTPALS